MNASLKAKIERHHKEAQDRMATRRKLLASLPATVEDKLVMARLVAGLSPAELGALSRAVERLTK